MAGAAGDGLGIAIATANGLVNATPVGMVGSVGLPCRADLLHPDLWVVDVVYRPLHTEFLRQARRIGCRTLNGGPMLVYQAAEAFNLFTGIRPDAGRMLAHFAELTG